MQSPFLEKPIDLLEVEMGLRVAENEKRDEVEQEYEDEALASDDPDEELDEIDHTESRACDGAPEVQAIPETDPQEDS